MSPRVCNLFQELLSGFRRWSRTYLPMRFLTQELLYQKNLKGAYHLRRRIWGWDLDLKARKQELQQLR